MFSYNLSLALKSLRDKPMLTLLTVLAISVGLGLYTTVKTMAYQSEKVPLRHKSENIFLIQMDNRELSAPEIELQARMVDTTYQDTMNLMRLNLPGVSQTFTWKTFGILNVQDENIMPIRSQALVGTSSFFTMFETPFLFGSGWDQSVDNSGEAVVVISKEMNDRLFGGIDSVGQILRLNTLDMKVVGVLDTWPLSRRFYDRSFRASNPDDFYIPYKFALENDLPRAAGFDCWSSETANAREFRSQHLAQLMTSECAWITFWAEIPNSQQENYQQQLERYITEQKEFGRFPRELKTYVTNLNEQVAYINSRNGFINVFSIIATLFFAVCLLNAISILLAKFMRRTKEVSLRRALGAKKHTIINQHLIEVMMIGAVGGLLGLVISYFGLKGMMYIRLYQSDYFLRIEDLIPMYQLDLIMIGQAFVTGIICTLIASIYPIWRLCNTPPASQLKSQ